MAQPGFTAEASLHSVGKAYQGAVAQPHSTPQAGVVPQQKPAANSVEAQYAIGGWSWWCPPPFCGRDEYGHCHCLTVTGGGGLAW